MSCKGKRKEWKENRLVSVLLRTNFGEKTILELKSNKYILVKEVFQN